MQLIEEMLKDVDLFIESNYEDSEVLKSDRDFAIRDFRDRLHRFIFLSFRQFVDDEKFLEHIIANLTDYQRSKVFSDEKK